MLRLISNTKISDHKHTSELIQIIGRPSVNQMLAQTKLTETWKANNIKQYPLQFPKHNQTEHNTRLSTDEDRLIESAFPNKERATFICDCPRVWNRTPRDIKCTKSISSAKVANHKYVTTLPV